MAFLLRAHLLTSDASNSIVGFLAGFSLAASVAAYNLLDEYKLASAALQASVDELQLSTEKVNYVVVSVVVLKPSLLDICAC